jgi:BASS family bile acid:Na+ symporter
MLLGVAVGLSLPNVAEFMRPLVVPISIIMAVISMLRIEPEKLVATFRRPIFLTMAGLFVLIVLPAMTFLLSRAFGMPAWLVTGLTFASASPPVSSAAAFAILVRVDPGLVTGISIPATLVAPVTVWFLTSSFPELGKGVELGALVLRLSCIILGALFAALIIRCLVGKERVSKWGVSLDGATVVLVTFIAIGVMYDIGLVFRSDPALLISLLMLTALVSYGSLLLTIATFWSVGTDEALAVGLCGSIKNMAVMVAAVLGTVDPRISIVVIIAQFPIFLSPLLMRPLFEYLRHTGARK